MNNTRIHKIILIALFILIGITIFFLITKNPSVNRNSANPAIASSDSISENKELDSITNTKVKENSEGEPSLENIVKENSNREENEELPSIIIAQDLKPTIKVINEAKEDIDKEEKLNLEKTKSEKDKLGTFFIIPKGSFKAILSSHILGSKDEQSKTDELEIIAKTPEEQNLEKENYPKNVVDDISALVESDELTSIIIADSTATIKTFDEAEDDIEKELKFDKTSSLSFRIKPKDSIMNTLSSYILVTDEPTLKNEELDLIIKTVNESKGQVEHTPQNISSDNSNLVDSDESNNIIVEKPKEIIKTIIEAKDDIEEELVPEKIISSLFEIRPKGSIKNTLNKYTLASWKPISENEELDLIISDSYEDNIVVEHYHQNIVGDAYSLVDINELSDFTLEDSKTLAKKYNGFTLESLTQEKSRADKSFIVKFYYSRNLLNVKFSDYDGEVLKSGKITSSPIETKQKSSIKNSLNNYTLAIWKPISENEELDLIITAPYKENILVEHYHQNILGDTYSLADSNELFDLKIEDSKTLAKEYNGFTVRTITQEKSATDKSYIVRFYYSRNSLNVKFTDYDGELLKFEKVKFGSNATEPLAPTKEGYTFYGWNTSFNNVTTNITVKAKYKANKDTKFIVEHFKQNVEDDEYTKVDSDTQTLFGTTNSKTQVIAKNYDGFKAKTINQQTIEPNNKTIVKIYYDRQYYSMIFNHYDEKSLIQLVKYGESITKPSPPTREGYTFKDWDKFIPNTMPAKDLTITAKWSVNQYKITFNIDSENIVESTIQDYGTIIKMPKNPIKEGYIFDGWDKDVPTTMPSRNVVVTGKWIPKTNTEYKVEHYKLNIEGNEYIKVEEDTQTLRGTTGTKTAAKVNAYKGFLPQVITQETIEPNNKTVVKVYYNKKSVVPVIKEVTLISTETDSSTEIPQEFTPKLSAGLFISPLFTNKSFTNLYDMSYGLGAEVSYDLSKYFILTNLQVHFADSNNLGCDTYIVPSITVGLGYPILLSKNIEIGIVGKYGLMTHWNGSTWYFNQRVELGLRVSNNWDKRLKVFFEGNGIVMFATPSSTIMFNGSFGLKYTIN